MYRRQKVSLVRLGLCSGGSLTACIALAPHRITARAPRLIVWAGLLAPTSCIRCRRGLGGAIPVAFPLPVTSLCPFWFVLADSDAVSEVLQLCHTPFQSCQVWERFCTGSPSLGAVRRRPWIVAQNPVPSCLALRRCWSSPSFRLRLPSGRYRDRGSLALAASPTCVLSSLGPASGPKLSWISLNMA